MLLYIVSGGIIKKTMDKLQPKNTYLFRVESCNLLREEINL